MVRRNHIIIDIEDYDSNKLSDENFIRKIIENLSDHVEGKVVKGPEVIYNGSGLTGMMITEFSQINLHSYPSMGDAAIDIYSIKAFDPVAIKKYLIKAFNLNLNSIKVKDVARVIDEIMIECEEHGCREKATKDWGGRKVCSDHYEWYRDKEHEFLKDTYDY